MTRYSYDPGAFEITSLPGQSQVAVCHSFFVALSQRGKRKGHQLKAKQRAVLKSLHHDYAICTVAEGNAAQKAILSKAGWQKIAEFNNHRSREITEIWGTTP